MSSITVPRTSQECNVIINHNKFLVKENVFSVTLKGYLLNELQARISQILDKLARKVQPEYAAFEPPVTPTHAQIGTLTASPVMPCS
jgi:hypothetical protein